MSKQKEEQNKIKELEEKVKSLEDQLKRVVADYRNLEKRVADDALSLATYSKAQLIVKILPVLDSLDQAVGGASEAEAESSWIKGVLMSIKGLRQVLAEEGLVEIPADGNFDPNFHEAVDVVEGEDGKIIKVSLRGYTLGGKILRPAKVIVGRKTSPEVSDEAKKKIESEEV